MKTEEYFTEAAKEKKFISRRINVTQKEAYTKKLSEMNIYERFGVTVTRVYRAGIEFVASPDTKLQFGDTYYHRRG